MNYETLLTEISDGILTVTINRPDKLNALNKTVIRELGEVVQEMQENASVQSAIITGSGNKAFVAGADIAEFQQMETKDAAALARRGQAVFHAIARSSKPIVAAVNGFALGGGCELAMACHFIYASENAKFGQPEVNLGLIPGYGGTQRMTQRIGPGRAIELLTTGNMLSATEAAKLGLVNAVFPQEDLLQKTKETLQLINSKAPIAIAKIIACVNRFDHTDAGFEFEAQNFGECFGTADAGEGIAAFLEKRKPKFAGK